VKLMHARLLTSSSRYRKAHAQRKQLALTTENEDRKIKEAEHGMQMPIEGWHYTPKNALMYYPEERALAIPSKIDKARSKPMSVSHANTRFAAGSPSKSGRHGLGTVSSAVSSEAASADGGSDSPKVNGYGFVVTPSPRPGVDLDPTMTWGVIDGTPFRLDAADSAAVASGPIFALPSQSAREKAEIQMQDEAARRKRKRAEHDQAVRTPQQRPRSGATPTSTAARLATMSPAAQRLGAQMFKGRSGVLSASYSRTPGTTPRSTPLRGATTTPLGTPRAGGSTPRSSRDLHGAGAGSVAAAIAASSGSITDGLL
jgi:protein DGCR14